jgi:hypothetical protein
LALALFLGTTPVFAQNQVKTIGNVFVEVKKGGSFEIATDSSLVMIPSFAGDSVFFDFPVFEKMPLTVAGTRRIFFCYHCVNYDVTVSTFHKSADEITVYAQIELPKSSYIRKNFILKKGEAEIFRLENDFSLRAAYKD